VVMVTVRCLVCNTPCYEESNPANQILIQEIIKLLVLESKFKFKFKLKASNKGFQNLHKTTP
jgi:hypothetical protein